MPKTKEYFRILAPFTEIGEIAPLKQAGADELYCGYVSRELSKRWPLAFNILNRRGEGFSFENYADFRLAAKEARMHGLDVYVTVNGLYTPEQYIPLLRMARELESTEGVKGVIVADIGFLLYLKQKKFAGDIHVSTGGTCFNAQTADFYRQLGARRVVLDRQMSSREIKATLSSIQSDIDVEIFILREGCGGFIDGFCTFFHCMEESAAEELAKGIFLHSKYNTEYQGHGCQFLFNELKSGNFKVLGPAAGKAAKPIKYRPELYPKFGCRICELFALKDCRIKSLKVIGRGRYSSDNIKAVRLLSGLLRILRNERLNSGIFRKKCKNLLASRILGRKCRRSDCYYADR